MIALALQLLLPVAVADRDSTGDTACQVPALTEVRPGDGQTDVPVDARFLALFEEGDCGEGSLIWELTQEGVDEPLQEDSASSSGGRASLEPDEDLPESTWLELLVTDRTENRFQHEFWTSGLAAEQVEVSPWGVLSDVAHSELDGTDDRAWRATLDLEFKGFESGLSLVQVFDVDHPAEPLAEVTAVATGAAWLDLAWTGESADTLCLYLVQEDEAGRGSERSDDVCASEIDAERSGCSAVGSAAMAVWWLLLMPLWQRRG